MFNRALLVSFCLAALSMTLPASAQNTGSRIGVINIDKVFRGMAETADVTRKINEERELNVRQETTKRAEISTLAEALKQARENLKADSQQVREAEERLVEANVRFRIWGEMAQAKLQRDQKQQMRTLLEKIEIATAEVAQQKGLDLVLAQGPKIPDNVDNVRYEEVQALINQRVVIYAAPKMDISDEVLAVADRNYRSQGAAK